MQVDLTKISQDYSLNGGALQSFVHLQLPNGKMLRLELDESQTEEVLKASAQEREDEDTKAPINTFDYRGIQEVQPTELEEQVQDQVEIELDETHVEMVRWRDLSEDVLPASMKALMETLGAAPEMPTDDLVRLIDEISERMAAQAEMRPPVQAPQPQLQQPQQPQVQVGKMQLSRIPSRRTVPMDDAGNPIAQQRVPQRSISPEITDDQGVSQL